MFYTLATRIPILSGQSNNFLTIFIVGSVGYKLLHYYLFSGEHNALLEKLKSYLYYLMVVDLIVAYLVSKWFSSPQSAESIEKHSYDAYGKEKRREISNNLQELKRMQEASAEQYKQKMMQQSARTVQPEQEHVENDNDATASQQSPFMTREEIKNEEKSKSEKSKSDKSNEETKKTESTSSRSTSSESSSPEKPTKKNNNKSNNTKAVKGKTVLTKQNKNKKVEVDTDVNLPVYNGAK